MVPIDERRSEEALGSHEALATKANDAAVREFVLGDEHSGVIGELILELKVIADIAKLLLHLTDCLEVSSAVEGVTAEEEELNEVARNVTTGHIDALSEVRERETLEDRDNVGHTIARVHHDTSQQTLRTKEMMIRGSKRRGNCEGVPWA